MCLKTRNYFVTDQESFLRHHQLFSMLICEIYNILILNQAKCLTNTEIFHQLTPFLKSRIRFVNKHDGQTSKLFFNELEMVDYIATLLADKIFKIHKRNNEYYYVSE